MECWVEPDENIEPAGQYEEQRYSGADITIHNGQCPWDWESILSTAIMFMYVKASSTVHGKTMFPFSIRLEPNTNQNELVGRLNKILLFH